MPLPNYSPRSDSFGNWYFGGFQMDSQVEAGYGAGTALNQTQSEFNTFLTSALGGSTNWAVSGSDYYFRFNNAYEPLTGTVSTSANYRFRIAVSRPGFNTAPTGTPIVALPSSSTSLGFSNMWSASFCAYAVANQYGAWFAYATKGTAGTLTTFITSVYLGWVKDPVFPTNTSERVRNLIVGQGTNNTDLAFACTGAPSTDTSVQLCYTNSVISCSASTPGANVSDLCFLSSGQSYLNIGSAYNAVFYPGTGLTLGRLYRIPPAQDPDGNTEQNIWLCAGQVYGWNGSSGASNAGYKLIRVWTNNIT